MILSSPQKAAKTKLTTTYLPAKLSTIKRKVGYEEEDEKIFEATRQLWAMTMTDSQEMRED